MPPVISNSRKQNPPCSGIAQNPMCASRPLAIFPSFQIARFGSAVASPLVLTRHAACRENG